MNEEMQGMAAMEVPQGQRARRGGLAEQGMQ